MRPISTSALDQHCICTPVPAGEGLVSADVLIVLMLLPLCVCACAPARTRSDGDDQHHQHWAAPKGPLTSANEVC